MTYSVNAINTCTKKLTFSFENLDLTTEIKAALVKKQKASNLKGFRKGKAPLGMVEQLFGPQIETEALNNFIQTKFYDAITKENLRVVGYPSFENMQYEKGKSVSFDAMVEIFPEVDLKDYSHYEFKKEKVEVTADDVTNMLKNYLGNKAEMLEVKTDTGVEKGQFAVVNFEGEKENGDRPDEMKGSEHLLEIGSNTFIPGFEEGLVGMKKGEKKTLELTFPEDYHLEELKNAKVKFYVELLEIKEKKLPDFTDELAKEFGYESVADFEKKNTEGLKKQKERQASQKLHQQILEKFIKENSFEVPHALISQQEGHVKEDLSKNLKSQGFTYQMLEEYFVKWHKDLHAKAEFQVRSALILDQLAKKYQVEVSDAELDAKFDEMATGTGLTADQLKKYYTSNQQIKDNLIYATREEKTFEKLLADMKVS